MNPGMAGERRDVDHIGTMQIYANETGLIAPAEVIVYGTGAHCRVAALPSRFL